MLRTSAAGVTVSHFWHMVLSLPLGVGSGQDQGKRQNTTHTSGTKESTVVLVCRSQGTENRCRTLYCDSSAADRGWKSDFETKVSEHS